MFLIYDSYKLNQNRTQENQIQQIININKEFMFNNLKYIKKEIKTISPLMLLINKEITNKKLITEKDVTDLKEELSEKFNLKEKGLLLEVFVLNKEYRIVNSSNSFDNGYDISINKNEKDTLSSIQEVNLLKESKGIFFDSFENKIKKYGFMKLEDSSFIGIGLVFEFSKKHKESFINLVKSLHAKLNYRYVIRDTNNMDYTMDLFMNKTKYQSREEYYHQLYDNKIKSFHDSYFIYKSKIDKRYIVHKDNKILTYCTLLQKDNQILPLFADVILEIESDISNENVFFQNTYKHVIYFIFLHIIMILLIFYFTTSYQKLEVNLKKAIIENHNLIKYNKNFIANMVHQIRTPLTVIMSNLSFLEYFTHSKNKHSLQINESIRELSNSYENLSYINSSDSLSYKKNEINLSEFLKSRVDYFESAADSKEMNLITNINNDCYFTINDIELERIIDNNIINMITYSSYQKDGYITLKNSSLGTIISFKNHAKKIEDETLLFQKNVKKEDVLQMGLYTVKLITDKYNIKITFKREGDYNIFEYSFNILKGE